MCHIKSLSPRKSGVTASLCVLTFRGAHCPPPCPPPWPSLLPFHLCGSDKSWVGQHVRCSVISAHKCVLFSNGRSIRIGLTSPSLFESPQSDWAQHWAHTLMVDCVIAQTCVLVPHKRCLYFIWPFVITMELRKGWIWLRSWDGWVFLSVFMYSRASSSPSGHSIWFFQVCFLTDGKISYLAVQGS